MPRYLLLFLLLFSALAHAEADWRLVRDDKDRDIRVFVRDQQGNPYHSFYAVTHIRTRLSTAVAVLADVPATPEWVARVSQVKLLKREADREAWVYTIYKLPYPFLQRDAVLHSVLTQDAKTGAVTVDTRTTDTLAPKARLVRLTDLHSTWTLTPQAEGVLKVEFWGEGNPGGYIPSWLFNYNLPDEPALTFRNLRRMVQRPKYQQATLAYIREPRTGQL